jgi:hypothetical protein
MPRRGPEPLWPVPAAEPLSTTNGTELAVPRTSERGGAPPAAAIGLEVEIPRVTGTPRLREAKAPPGPQVSTLSARRRTVNAMASTGTLTTQTLKNSASAAIRSESPAASGRLAHRLGHRKPRGTRGTVIPTSRDFARRASPSGRAPSPSEDPSSYNMVPPSDAPSRERADRESLQETSRCRCHRLVRTWTSAATTDETRLARALLPMAAHQRERVELRAHRWAFGCVPPDTLFAELPAQPLVFTVLYLRCGLTPRCASCDEIPARPERFRRLLRAGQTPSVPVAAAQRFSGPDPDRNRSQS